MTSDTLEGYMTSNNVNVQSFNSVFSGQYTQEKLR